MSENLSEAIRIRVDSNTRDLMEKRAAEERRTLSNLVRVAIDTYLTKCPACDGPTFVRDGVRYCRRCNMAVKAETPPDCLGS